MSVPSTQGFVLIDALMVMLLLSITIVVVLRYQSKQVMAGLIVTRHVELQQRLQCYHEECIIARHRIPHPENWCIHEAPVMVSVKRCSFPVQHIKTFCWQQICVPWPEVSGIRERYVVSGYAQE